MYLCDRMADGAGPSSPGYPIQFTHPLVYHDYETGSDSICDPISRNPCWCMGFATHFYPNWVVHQLERERNALRTRVDTLRMSLELATQKNEPAAGENEPQEQRIIPLKVASGVKRPATNGTKTETKKARSTVRCQFCGRTNHIENDCWRKTHRCLRCGSKDHKIKSCPLMTKGLSRKAKINSEADPSKKSCG